MLDALIGSVGWCWEVLGGAGRCWEVWMVLGGEPRPQSST